MHEPAKTPTEPNLKNVTQPNTPTQSNTPDKDKNSSPDSVIYNEEFETPSTVISTDDEITENQTTSPIPETIVQSPATSLPAKSNTPNKQQESEIKDQNTLSQPETTAHSTTTSSPEQTNIPSSHVKCHQTIQVQNPPQPNSNPKSSPTFSSQDAINPPSTPTNSNLQQQSKANTPAKSKRTPQSANQSVTPTNNDVEADSEDVPLLVLANGVKKFKMIGDQL